MIRILRRLLPTLLVLGAGIEATLACQQGNSSVNTTRVTSGNAVTITPGYSPSAGSDQVFAFSVTVQNLSNASCTFVLSVKAISLPAAMTNGTFTMQYAVERPGGTAIMHTGATTSAATSSASVTLGANGTTTVNLQVRLPASQTTANGAGTYIDSTGLIEVWELSGANPTTLRSQVALIVSNTRTGSCTISGTANASQTIGINNSTGLTTGMATASPSFNVTCTIASNVTLSSQNGAVTNGNVAKNTLSSVSGYRNKIEYTAVVNAPAASVTLTTSSSAIAPVATAPLVFSNANVTNRATTVTITPETSPVPLLAGSYGDLLTVTVAPQ